MCQLASPLSAESRAEHTRRLDLVGMALVTLALTSLVLPLVEGPQGPATSTVCTMHARPGADTTPDWCPGHWWRPRAGLKTCAHDRHDKEPCQPQDAHGSSSTTLGPLVQTVWTAAVILQALIPG